MTEHEAETDLMRSGFQRGYALCNGRWVKCMIPPNAIGPVRIPHRHINGIRVTIGREEYNRLPMTSRQILAFHETPSHLYVLMRPYLRHGQEPAESTWWRKTWNGDEFVEVGERPAEDRPALARIPALDI